MWKELWNSIKDGNMYMMIIFLLAFICSVLITRRFILLQLVYTINFKKFLSDLKKMIAAEDLDRAKNLCRSAKSDSLPKIALKAIELSEVDPSSVKGAIEEDTVEFLPKVESGLATIPALSTIILLTGILGTIDGLWGAFHSIDVLDTAKKQASLANGIASSLNPTALGLIVCMLILAAHQFLKAAAVKLTEEIHYGITVLHNLLVPQEMPTFAMAAAPMAPAAAAPEAVSEPIPEPEPAGVASDDAFDDASVEDIKDEEEII